MIFYHYTSHEALESIMEQGLNRGEAPLSDRRVVNAVNLTTDPDPTGHGLDNGGHVVTQAEAATLAAAGIRVSAGTVFTEKRAIRIKVKLGSGDTKLKQWRQWSRKHCEPGYADKLEKAAGAGRKPRTWWLYFGTIQPTEFLAVEVLNPRA